MPMFRKKPVQVEARQVPEMEGSHEAPAQMASIAQWCDGDLFNDAVDGWCILIDTPEGQMKAQQGDWVIKEPFETDERQFCPCKPAIFAETYEAA